MGFKDCQACPPNTFTFQPSAPSKDRCRSKCAPGLYIFNSTILLKKNITISLFKYKFSGFYSSTGLAPCSPCPINFYQNVIGLTTCNECPTNMKTDSPGSIGREDCKPVVCTENSCQHGGLCVPMGHTVQW